MQKKNKLLVVGGGTGGHIYPILEVASFLKKRNKIDILYVGGKGNMEEQIVPKVLPFESIPVGKLRRHLTWLHLRDSVRFIKGTIAARRIINQFKPKVIFAKGGYVSLPIIAIAKLKKIPLVIHESDAVMGLANRLSARAATIICLGFPVRFYPKNIAQKGIYTGTPIRSGFTDKVMVKDRQQFMVSRGLPVILIAGGSQGAGPINSIIKPILHLLLVRSQIIHLTGEISSQEFEHYKHNLAPDIQQRYHPYAYIKNMEAAVRVADLVISRAGSSLFEFSAAGLPMLLIPLPTSAANHQVKNAEYYTKHGAAITIKQYGLTSERLLRTLTSLLNDRHRLVIMSQNAKKISKPDAVDEVARIIENLLKK